jgi:hypothetical protein
MQSQFKINVVGQELEVDDVNSISDNAAHADDIVLAELVRMAYGSADGIARGILPYGFRNGSVTDWPQSAAPVYSNNNSSVHVPPVRCMIGTRDLTNQSSPATVRSAIAR